MGVMPDSIARVAIAHIERGLRYLGWGALLPAVTVAYLWLFGVFSIAVDSGRGNLFGATTLAGSDLYALIIVTLVAVYTAVAPRLAGYLAAVGLVALGLFELYVAAFFPSPSVYAD